MKDFLNFFGKPHKPGRIKRQDAWSGIDVWNLILWSVYFDSRIANAPPPIRLHFERKLLSPRYI